MVNKYPNLVILRSISKEFGVPGIRLGYILTENKVIKNTIMKNLPIWNINSIAEYFIENFVNYQKSYEKSIRKMIADKEELYNNLSKISYLKILPSHANFFFAKVDGSAKMLKEKLFNDFKILIKNCSNKKPLEKDNYVRISLKNKEDNNKLVAALMSLNKDHLTQKETDDVALKQSLILGHERDIIQLKEKIENLRQDLILVHEQITSKDLNADKTQGQIK